MTDTSLDELFRRRMDILWELKEVNENIRKLERQLIESTKVIKRRGGSIVIRHEASNRAIILSKPNKNNQRNVHWLDVGRGDLIAAKSSVSDTCWQIWLASFCNKNT